MIEKKNILFSILDEIEKNKQYKPEEARVLGQTKPVKRDFWDKHSIKKSGESLGQTPVLGQTRGDVWDKQLIDILRNVRVLLLPISSSKNTVRRGGKKYVYIRKRVDLPSDYNEENVVVLSPSEFMKLMGILSIAFEKAFGVSFDMEKVRKWLFSEEE